MTWTRLSDDYADDCWTLSDAAFRLHTEGLCWSNRKLLDLGLSKEDVRRFAKHPEAADELVACGWWTDDGDHYVIRHHALYQRAKADVLAQQDANRRNGSKGGRPPKVGREQASALSGQHPSETQSVSDSLSDSKSERDGTGLDWTGSVPATQLERTTQLEEEQHTHARANDDRPPCAVAGCSQLARSSCRTCADHMTLELDCRRRVAS